jgi:hypothetical protein
MAPLRPDSAFVPPAFPDTSVCAGSTTVAFRTDFLEGVNASSPGAQAPGATAAFRAAWHNAVVATGNPGPALIVLSRLGLLQTGEARRLRFGTPGGRLQSDGGPLFAFERPAANPPNVWNPLDGTFDVTNTTRVRGTVLGTGGTASVFLRFVGADRVRYDIPVVGVSLDAYLRADLAGRCVALDIVDMALGFPASALGLSLDGHTLSTLLDAPVAPDGGPSLAVVHLAGPAAVVPYEEVP